MLSISKKKTSGSIDSKSDSADSLVPLTRSYVIEQLVRMGYERDILPDSVIDAFIQEINYEIDEGESMNIAVNQIAELEESTTIPLPLDEFSFVSEEAVECRNSNNQIIIKNHKTHLRNDIPQIMERLDALDFKDDISEFSQDQAESYQEDFTNITNVFYFN